MKTITAKQVKQKVENGDDVVVVNALSSKSFAAKHIPGSISIPAGEVKDTAKQVLADPNQTIIVHCSNKNCSASTNAVQALEEMGYANVYDFETGLTGWLREAFTLSKAS